MVIPINKFFSTARYRYRAAFLTRLPEFDVFIGEIMRGGGGDAGFLRLEVGFFFDRRRCCSSSSLTTTSIERCGRCCD